MKKFMKKTEGFTLVELIVVIAILGILAGVGTVGYSGYIKKANMAADEQLAASVKQSLELGYYSNIGKDFSGYVVLSKDAAPSVADGTISDASVESYLKATFGEDLSGMKLKYSGWAIPAGFMDAATSAQAASVSKSSYITNSNVPELLGNVQTVTSAAAGLLGSVVKNEDGYIAALRLALNDDYLKEAHEKNIIGKDENGNYILKEGTYTAKGDGKITPSADLQNQLANLMVMSVAEELEKATTEEMQGLMLSGLNVGAQVPGYSAAAMMASQYALYKAYAVDTGKTTEFDAMNARLQQANSRADAETALGSFMSENKDDLLLYLADSETGALNKQFADNANSIAAIMGGVNTVKDKYTDSLSSSSLFTTGDVSNDLNAYLSIAAVGETLTDDQKEALSAGDMMVTLGKDGACSILGEAN